MRRWNKIAMNLPYFNRVFWVSLLTCTLVMMGCSTHERDNPYDKNGDAYDDGATIDASELGDAAKYIGKEFVKACDAQCVEGVVIFTAILTVHAALEAFKIADGLGKVSESDLGFSIPSLPDELTDIPGSVDLPDYSDDVEAYYDRLKEVDPADALQALELTSIDLSQYEVADIASLSTSELEAVVQAFKVDDLISITEALMNTLRETSAHVVESNEYKDEFGATIDQLEWNTDSLLMMIDSDESALTAAYWSADPVFEDELETALLQKLSESKASAYWTIEGDFILL